MNITAILLALSLVANAALGYAYLNKRDTAVAATTTLTRAGDDVKACNDSVDNIAVQGASNAAAAAPARESAKANATKLNTQADTILTTHAAAPGNDCKSVQARANDWFKEAP